ncbi:hypothetical protein MTR67_051433 [Solanum verrucosum]|uniref:Uncharacterized protein n=1 Tax=Solanum verrucosum TaxID=315347 RepID=A0AAF0V7C3_SOLVR|nr:hypothetical protein MTR67_051433 [Solanum verrucosum]
MGELAALRVLNCLIMDCMVIYNYHLETYL